MHARETRKKSARNVFYPDFIHYFGDDRIDHEHGRHGHGRERERERRPSLAETRPVQKFSIQSSRRCKRLDQVGRECLWLCGRGAAADVPESVGHDCGGSEEERAAVCQGFGGYEAWRPRHRHPARARLRWVSNSADVRSLEPIARPDSVLTRATRFARPPDASHIPGAVNAEFFKSIQGLDPVKIVRRAVFAFFGILNGTEYVLLVRRIGTGCPLTLTRASFARSLVQV